MSELNTKQVRAFWNGDAVTMPFDKFCRLFRGDTREHIEENGVRKGERWTVLFPDFRIKDNSVTYRENDCEILVGGNEHRLITILRRNNKFNV